MSTVSPYSEQSHEFAEMIRQADTDPKAAFAAANCYMHGSYRFCQDWYQCFILHELTEQEYDARVALVQECLNIVNTRKTRDVCCDDENCS